MSSELLCSLAGAVAGLTIPSALMFHRAAPVAAAACVGAAGVYLWKRGSCRHSAFWPAVGLGATFAGGAICTATMPRFFI